MDQKIIDFIKGLMQPALTLVAICLFWAMSVSGKFAPDDVYKVVVGIILFWFGYTFVKNFNFTGNGGTGTTGTPPKASSGTPTATADGGAAAMIEGYKDTWQGQGGYNDQAGILTPEPQPTIMDVFDVAKFTQKVLAMADSVQAWVNKTATSLAQAAVEVYWGMRFNNDKAAYAAAETMVGYMEKWFKEKWFGDANFNCEGLDCIAYAQAHINDGKGCTTCGAKGLACPWSSLEAKADYLETPAGGYRQSLDRLRGFQEIRDALRAKLS